ncbi:unnamed protein product [Symbiodinium pilosum]|uniref:Uncharacterized protein n=1 Tax=Symbiodinium pilosum TaxID=2952 RepID=A0A812PUU2_SYMPI|nr:unnamed protein product [Symbiodinium pilosum]
MHQWHLHLDRQERWATCLQSPSKAFVPLYGTQGTSSKPGQEILSKHVEVTGIALTMAQGQPWFWSMLPGVTSSPSEGFLRRLESFKDSFGLQSSCKKVY